MEFLKLIPIFKFLIMKRMFFLLMLMPVMVWAQDDVINEVCGVKFGSSYESVIDLDGAIGELDIEQSDKNRLLFWDVMYRDVFYSYAFFTFTYKGGNSYLDEVAFHKGCDSIEEARVFRWWIATTFGLQTDFDDDTIKGGRSPRDPKAKGFFIYIKRGIIERLPYEVVVRYGPYGYDQ